VPNDATFLYEALTVIQLGIIIVFENEQEILKFIAAAMARRGHPRDLSG
jgi:hypothetical protein